MIKNFETVPVFGEGSSQYIGSTVDRATLAKSLRERLQDIELDKFVSFITNEFKEQLEYVRLCAGENACKHTSLLFNPHRLCVKSKNSKYSVFEATQTESFCDGIARVILWQNASEQLITFVQRGINGVQYINEFPPFVARQLAINYGLNSGSSVLDPCAGWGGRMLGFSTIVNSYSACEPSTRTYEGLLQLSQFIQSFRPEFRATILCEPFEDVKLLRKYDFALTSPPYYDTEEYTKEETNSLNRYKSFEAWSDYFYLPLIKNTMNALKENCAFVLNIGSRVYPLSTLLKTNFGKQYEITKLKGYLTTQGLGKSGEGETFYEIKK